MKKYLEIYKKAFLVINRNAGTILLIFLISLGSSLNEIYNLITGKMPANFLVILTIPFFFLNIASLFLPTVVYNEILNGNKININFVKTEIYELFKKCFFPYLGLIFVSTVFYIIIMSLSIQFKSTLPFTFYRILIILSAPVFSYFGIFFILKKMRFLDSLKNSVFFTKNNLGFSYLTLVFNLPLFLLSTNSIIPIYIKLLSYLCFTILSVYISNQISCALLIYYRTKTKEKI
jgi:hypothetical protein